MAQPKHVKIHHIRATLKNVEREIQGRGHKYDPTMKGIHTVLQQLLKQVEVLTYEVREGKEEDKEPRINEEVRRNWF